MTNTCKTCAWYCHSDGKCYGTQARLSGLVDAVDPIITCVACEDWAFDGLEDWEREDCEKSALMTMELA